jgi:hypothetical protein
MKPRPTLLLALTLLFTVGAAPTTQPASAILSRAHHILETMKASSYQHPTDIDAAAGRYNCDCSGLVGWLLRQDLPAHYRAIRFAPSAKRPRAFEFYKAFAAAPTQPATGALWQQIPRLADARPGDLLAWKKDPMPAKGSTGHIVLFDSTPTQVAPGLYEVTVIDSNSATHKADTRKPGQTGVGRGTVYFQTDPDGHPTACASKAPTGRFFSYPMAIARPVTP